MQLIALSDLHIEGVDDPLYAALITILRTRLAAEDVLILAGDIFDFWVGDKEVFRKRYGEFFDAVEAAGKQGTQIYYIEGNHDFHLKKAFAGIPHFHLLTDEIDLEFGGKRFFIAHGDKVDQEDYGYRFLRSAFRTPITRAIVKAVPDRVIEKIGTCASQMSRNHGFRMNGVLPIHLMTETRRKFRSFSAEKMSEGYDFVILGHCHDDDEMRFRVGERQGQYINIGYPRVHGRLLIWKEGADCIIREKIPGF